MEKGPLGRRRGRGARERILSASQQLFRDQGINRTGMDQLCAGGPGVESARPTSTSPGKDELVAEYLRRWVDPDVTGGVFDRADLTPRERLLAAFEVPATGAQDITPMCPYIAASIEIHDPQHPRTPSTHATTRKPSPRGSPKPPAKAKRHQRPEQLGEQLAAAARWRLGPQPSPQAPNPSHPTAAAIAAVLIDNAIPTTAQR